MSLNKIEQQLSGLAEALLNDTDSMNIAEKIDVFKAVASWHTTMLKATKGRDQVEDPHSFAAMAERLKSKAA